MRKEDKNKMEFQDLTHNLMLEYVARQKALNETSAKDVEARENIHAHFYQHRDDMFADSRGLGAGLLKACSKTATAVKLLFNAEACRGFMKKDTVLVSKTIPIYRR